MEKEKEGMMEEVSYAVEFWMSHLSTCPKNNHLSDKEKENKEKESPPLTELDTSCLDVFREALTQLLQERFLGHWYPDDKLRGSAYRSVSYDTRMDAIFLKAAEKAGVDRIEDRLEPVRYYIMFINPGEVKVKNTRLWTSEAKYIWSKRGEVDDSGSASPPTSPTSTSGSKSTNRKSSPVPSPSSTNSSPTSVGSSDTSRFHSSPSSRPPRTRVSPTESRVSSTNHVPPHVVRRKPGPSPYMNGTSVPPAPRRSPSPPPLSLDQPYAGGYPGHSFSPSSSTGTSFRFREPSPGTVAHPEPFSQHGPSHGHGHGPSHGAHNHGPHFGGPRGNVSNGTSFSYNNHNKYLYPAPRSRTPSPPLLNTQGNFYRSHSSPARHPTHHHHPSQTHEPPRPHSHHGMQHDYGNRFLPRYRQMGLTRS